MSLHDDPSILTIPVTTKFPTTDYGTKLLLARNWVRKRHPDGPVSVYAKRREIQAEIGAPVVDGPWLVPHNTERDRSGAPKEISQLADRTWPKVQPDALRREMIRNGWKPKG